MRNKRNIATVLSGLSLLVSLCTVSLTVNKLLKNESRKEIIPYGSIAGLTTISWLYLNEKRKYYNSQLKLQSHSL